MEGFTEFFALMAATVLSISFALLLEWLLLRGVFRALARCRAGSTQPYPSPRPAMPPRVTNSLGWRAGASGCRATAVATRALRRPPQSQTR